MDLSKDLGGHKLSDVVEKYIPFSSTDLDPNKHRSDVIQIDDLTTEITKLSMTGVTPITVSNIEPHQEFASDLLRHVESTSRIEQAQLRFDDIRHCFEISSSVNRSDANMRPINPVPITGFLQESVLPNIPVDEYAIHCTQPRHIGTIREDQLAAFKGKGTLDNRAIENNIITHLSVSQQDTAHSRQLSTFLLTFTSTC